MKNLLLIFCALLLLSSKAYSQTLTLTAPLVPQEFKSGDDYFTDVLESPADGTHRRMIGWEENFAGTSVKVENGIWKGTVEIPGAYVFPLFPGLKNTLKTDSLSNEKGLPKFGIKYPINSSKYSHLAFKMNHSTPSQLIIYWESDLSKPQWWPTIESPRAGRPDAILNHANRFWNIRHFDMKNLAQSFTHSNKTWSGDIYALRIDPSTSAQAGATLEFDWIRLVDPSSAPHITITWNSAGLTNTEIIIINHSNSASGYNGTPIGKVPFNQNSYTFPSAILPPGEHYFYLEVGKYFDAGETVKSNYSTVVNIKAKPELAILAPAPDSGESYSVKTRNKEWDMTPGSDDIYNLRSEFSQVWRQFIAASYAPNPDSQLNGHVFQALAEPPYFHIGNQESDVQFHFNVPQDRPINPNDFRYIVYRMAVGEDGFPSISDKVSKGWVSRVVGWNNEVTQDRYESKAHIVYEGWNTYWFDAKDINTYESGQPWDSFSSIRKLRLDPGEFNIPGHHTWVLLDYFKLMSENRAKNNTYDIKFSIKGSQDGKYLTNLYHSTDLKGSNLTLITSLEGLTQGEHSYTWNTSALPEGKEYYIFIEISDGIHLVKRQSLVHVKTEESLISKAKFSSFDFSGDGKDDHIIYRPSNGSYFSRYSNGAQSIFPWGNSTFFPFRGDFDGDGIVDAGLMTVLGGFYYYYVNLSKGGLLATSWGLSGDYVVIGDYNGDGRDQIAVWRPSDGNWYILDENLSPSVIQWGLPGDIPVPGDFNGDGTTDPAVWRPSTGTWWLRNGTSTSDTEPVGQQWGLPGDIPVHGWYGNDKKAKFVVWRPSDGTWYVNDPSAGITMQQWGLPGDIPLSTDHNGDGTTDFTIYRNGVWYHNHRNGQTNAVGWGIPGDRLPLKVFFVQ